MGCFIELFALPFKAIYWFFKIIWEIGELFQHNQRHKRHKQKRVHKKPTVKKTTVPKNNTNRPVQKSAKTTKEDDEIPDEFAEALEKSMKMARDKRRKLDTRLDAYRESLRTVDKIRELLPDSSEAHVNFLEREILKEYRALMDTNTTTNGMITVGPSMNIKTGNDARREGLQGAQWCASDDSCPLCQFLDNMVISVDHPDFNIFVPPLHAGCKCVRVYIDVEENNVEFNWSTPPEELRNSHGYHP